MEYFRLTTPQQNIWNLQKYYGDTAIANLCGAIFFQEKRSETLLQEAIRLFIQNQSGLRLRFCEGEEPRQYISEAEAEPVPALIFASRQEFDQYAEDFARKPIGLVERPMYRFVVFYLEKENRSGILVTLSHLVSDAWTFGLMANQLDAAYRGLAGEGEYSLATGDYTEFIRSQEQYLTSERHRKDEYFWKSKYAVRPEECPVKLRSASEDGVEAGRIARTLAPGLEQRIAAYCREHSVTEAVLFETALAVYLCRINPDLQSVTIGVPVLNRSDAKEKGIAGMFVSTMPLTVTVERDMEALELARRIAKEHVDLFRHQKYPYTDILRMLREKQDFSGNVYDVMISYQNARTKTGADTRWYSNGCSEVPLIIHIDNRDGRECHVINVDYQKAVFGEEEVGYFLDRWEYILDQIVKGNTGKVCEIGIVPQREFEKVVYEFNDTYVDYPRDKCVHELFMEQASRTPDKVALVFEGKEFTYRQLDEMSNSLAYFLRGKGVKPNDVVPIIARRSWHVVVAMLGILKAGGAYMPVDPDYPEDRICQMMRMVDSKIALVYKYKGTLEIEAVVLDIPYVDNSSSIDNINSPEDMAYVIFTSGSTGEAKGVAICHRNIGNYVHNNNNNNVCHQIIHEHYQSIVSVTNIVFDIFVTESLLPLLNGLCIYFASDDEVVSQRRLSQLLQKNAIDVLQTTPTKMRSYIIDRKNTGYLGRLKAIILGGETFPHDLYQDLKVCTDAYIYNIYGPAEATVWSTNSEVTGTDITIGKPIANTQIYILNSDLDPVPIGVPGELCIAGDGVGKGYLNRPELTAEKFVPNPFATEENRHGKIMYRTGDLARFRSDGEIEYLGRIDTQVKIRGLRIELGEIESVMGSMEGIGLVAAADKRDENGRQYLVGYYTSEEAVDERELRSLLGAKLPRYMVPNYFMRLEAMPMTASGKTDRRNLPVPDFGQQTGEYVAPVTGRERELCRLMEELLHVERVGVTDDFFELGGDSLTAIEFLAKARDRGIDFSLQNVFDYPTVEQLCRHMEEGEEAKVLYAPSDFDRYRELLERNVAEADFVPQRKPLGNVLLTGATGFLGAHVLDRLLREETGKVYCLVRAGEEKTSSCRERLREILRYYFGDRYEAELAAGQAGDQTASGGRYVSRIIPVAGDIESEVMAENMPEDVNTVIHTAASVKHYGSYGYFHRVNVEGTKHVVNYARSVGARLIHISTLSVSGNSLGDDFTVYRSEEEKHFGETSLYIGQPLDNVYVHSKFEAERVVFDAMLGGLDARVIRVGNLTSRASDYRFQPNYRQNAFLTRVKAILEFGLFPDYLMPLYCEFSPIDLTAEGVVKIAQYADRQTVFHLNSNRPVYFDRFLEVVRELGISMKVVDGDTFNRALRGTVRDRVTEYIFEAFQNDMDGQGRLLYDSNIRIDNDFTVWFLNKLGFAWNEIDREYIRGYVEYFREIGYLHI